MLRSHHVFALALASVVIRPGVVSSQTIAPYYAGRYAYLDLGSAPGVPPAYGGVEFKADEPNTLYIGGQANSYGGKIYTVGVIRGAGNHITGFACNAVAFADAHGSTSGGIDGGLDFGPNGVLFYASYSSNEIGQIKPGSTSADRYINLTPLGVSISVGALQFVPEGYPGAGRLKIASYNASRWYDATVTPDGNGTFDITLSAVPSILIGGGPEGITFVPLGAPLFANPSVLVAEYSAGRVSAYEVDANGDPVVESRRDFITGLSGAEGATIDPLTGDFVFSTFGGGNRVLVVTGFSGIGTEPRLVGAVSRRQHGAAGSHDVVVPLGQPAIEPRRNGSLAQMILGFDSPIEAADGSADCGAEITVTNGQCSSVVVSGTRVTVNMTFDKNACVRVAVNGLRGINGGPAMAGENSVAVITHEGNVNRMAGVNILDLQAIKNHLNQTVDACTGFFIYDVDANGQINILDLQATKNNLNQPASCTN